MYVRSGGRYRPPNTPPMYSLSVTTISRRDGHSATAAAAYQSRDRVEDARTGLAHDYSRLGDCVGVGLVGWGSGREALWNTAEASERRKDSRVARRIILALPADIPDRNRVEITRDFAQKLRDEYGVAIDWAIHCPHRSDDPRNHHAHFLLTTREVAANGTFGAKTRVLDMQTTSAKEMEKIRAWAAEIIQQHGGDREKWDHRSYAKRGIDREPTEHEGRAARVLASHGVEVEVLRRNAAKRERNAAREAQEAAVVAAAQEALYGHQKHQLRATGAGLRGAQRTPQRDGEGTPTNATEISRRRGRKSTADLLIRRIRRRARKRRFRQNTASQQLRVPPKIGDQEHSAVVGKTSKDTTQRRDPHDSQMGGDRPVPRKPPANVETVSDKPAPKRPQKPKPSFFARLQGWIDALERLEVRTLRAKKKPAPQSPPEPEPPPKPPPEPEPAKTNVPEMSQAPRRKPPTKGEITAMRQRIERLLEEYPNAAKYEIKIAADRPVEASREQLTRQKIVEHLAEEEANGYQVRFAPLRERLEERHEETESEEEDESEGEGLGM